MEKFLSDSSLWAIGLAIALALAVTTELGYRLNGWWARKPANDAPRGEGGVHILGAVLGLLALILGFSFSMALDRFDGRRQLVLDEANAIGTAYLRAQILEGADRAALSEILRDYADARLEYFRAGADAEKQAASRQRADASHQRLWAATVTAVRPVLNQAFSTALIESMNQVMDLASSRRAAFGQHIPASVLETVIVYALISAAMLGYVLADTGRRHLVTSSVLGILLALIIALIVDIDRPNQGTVNVNITPLLEVQKMIVDAQAAAVATAPPANSAAAPAEPAAPAGPRDIRYACAGGAAVRAQFSPDFNSATVTLPDRIIGMTRAVAASGIRYTGSDYTFWSKGDTAFVMRGEATIIPDCRKN